MNSQLTLDLLGQQIVGLFSGFLFQNFCSFALKELISMYNMSIKNDAFQFQVARLVSRLHLTPDSRLESQHRKQNYLQIVS